jgi:flagellar hook-associated protein 3 FlgL
MRISASQTYRAQLEAMRQKGKDSFEAQKTAASGRRLLTPSDDPAGMQRTNLLRAMRSDLDVGRGKINIAQGELNAADHALGGMTSALSRLRELAVQMSSDTMGAPERSAAATEVEQIRSTLISLGNSRHGDKRLFAGRLTDTDPFAADGTYQGDSVGVSVTLANVTSVQVTIPGDELLRGATGGPDVLADVDAFATALATDDTAGIRQALTDLDAAMEHITDQRSLVGFRMNIASRMDVHFDSAEIGLIQEISEIEEADPVQAFSDVIRTQQAFEQAMQVSVASRTQNIFQML